MKTNDTTLSLSTGIGDTFNRPGLLAFINEETASSYMESPVVRFLFSLFPHLEQRGMSDTGDLYFCNLQNGALYVLPRNGWAHNFNIWFERQKVANQVGYVMRTSCISYLEKKISR